jgi:hypothetical protein
MSENGSWDELYVRARRALLDALDALGPHRGAVTLVGAQAIYVHTGDAQLAVALYTKDADVVLSPADLGTSPLIEEAMRRGGFELTTTSTSAPFPGEARGEVDSRPWRCRTGTPRVAAGLPWSARRSPGRASTC